MVKRLILFSVLVAVLGVAEAHAQVSSLGERQRQRRAASVAPVAPREGPKIQRNVVYDKYSWIATQHKPVKTYKVGDLITIIVRERRKFEADADLDTRKELDLASELDAFFKLTGNGIGAAEFRRGKPNIDYRYENRLRNRGDTEREDRLTTRLTGRIIDVKPNGVLVLEAQARVQHDDEISTMTLTGKCRKEDVTADNTVLSTQIANKNITVSTDGALRAASSRGWFLKILDWIGPF